MLRNAENNNYFQPFISNHHSGCHAFTYQLVSEYYVRGVVSPLLAMCHMVVWYVLFIMTSMFIHIGRKRCFEMRISTIIFNRSFQRTIEQYVRGVFPFVLGNG